LKKTIDGNKQSNNAAKNNEMNLFYFNSFVVREEEISSF
jgi:hypothetical protein